ncbi:hypothetical protein GCM10017691_57050 [Pseudonocardia petroleophila]|uniref:Uncharacterized protein n=1 Tax=Pseudonocardia petroleophila TaxID=37331 RepID=A0A7G7MN86_9PSEU|nr:hypothetical protein [Pseudonocardia petroleophila]QNG54247.1 hypothetical protein H6H00_10310 [Pseudonocardia petroleophila]
MDEWTRQQLEQQERSRRDGMDAFDAINRLFQMLAKDHEREVRESEERNAAHRDGWAGAASAHLLPGPAETAAEQREHRRWEQPDGYGDPPPVRPESRPAPDRFEPFTERRAPERDPADWLDRFEPEPRHRPGRSDPAPPPVDDAPRPPVTLAERASVADLVDGMCATYEQYRSQADVAFRDAQAIAGLLSRSERQELLLAATCPEPATQEVVARAVERAEWLYWNDPGTGFWAWLRRQDEFADRRRQEILAQLEAERLDRDTWSDLPGDGRAAPPPGVGATAAAARESGLEDAAVGRLGFAPHSRARELREAIGLDVAGYQSAHVLGQAMGKLIPHYSPGQALTTLLPPAAHAAFDQGWVHVWKRERRSGRGITAGMAYTMLVEALEAVPDHHLSPAARGTLAARLHQEMFGELRLRYETQLVAPAVDWT